MGTPTPWSSSTKTPISWAPNATVPTTKWGNNDIKTPTAYTPASKTPTTWAGFTELQDEVGNAILDEALGIIFSEQLDSTITKNQTGWTPN